jgi:hypothetical protein
MFWELGFSASEWSAEAILQRCFQYISLHLIDPPHYSPLAATTALHGCTYFNPPLPFNILVPSLSSSLLRHISCQTNRATTVVAKNHKMVQTASIPLMYTAGIHLHNHTIMWILWFNWFVRSHWLHGSGRFDCMDQLDPPVPCGHWICIRSHQSCGLHGCSWSMWSN